MRINRILLSLSVLVCLFLAMTAGAQASRTWVSGVGNDANPCSRTAPCKTFAGAFSKTAVCGEIDALDPGGYGAVTITKSITINGEGTLASILNSGGVNGVVINITASDVCNTVILRKISINGVPSAGVFGLNGIRDVSTIAHSLHIEHVDIRHTTAHGIDIHPTAGQQVILSLHNLRSRQSAGDGLRLQNNAKGTVTDSQIEQNNANGVNIFGSSIAMKFVSTDMSNNGAAGLVNASGANTFIDGCSFSGNGAGGINNTGSTMHGFGNNSFGNNTGGDVIGPAVVTDPHP